MSVEIGHIDNSFAGTGYGQLQSPTSFNMSPGALEIGIPAPIKQIPVAIVQESKFTNETKSSHNNNTKSHSKHHHKRNSSSAAVPKPVMTTVPATTAAAIGMNQRGLPLNLHGDYTGAANNGDVSGARSPLVIDDPTSPKQSHVFTFPIVTKPINTGNNNNKSSGSKESKESKSQHQQQQEQNQSSAVVPLHMRIRDLDVIELREFLNATVPPNYVLQLRIRRNKSGLYNSLFPVYTCYHEASNTLIMAAKKKPGNKTSNFIISLDTAHRYSDYLGKVRANFSGSEYILYDNGINPKKLKDLNQGRRRAREELGIVRFDNNIMGQSPRTLTVALPAVEVIQQQSNDKNSVPQTVITRKLWAPLSQTASMMERFKHDPDQRDMLVINNKEPVWNERLSAYALNFNGRAKIPSVKNFQLIKSDQPAYIILQYGKMEKDEFTLDIQFPMSPLQAFAIALAGVDNKLVCD